VAAAGAVCGGSLFLGNISPIVALLNPCAGMSGFAKGRAMGLIILIILIILLFGGGLGTRYGGWGGPGYASFGYGGIGLGTILIIVLIVLLVSGRL
jgi:hypothetical protein